MTKVTKKRTDNLEDMSENDEATVTNDETEKDEMTAVQGESELLPSAWVTRSCLDC